MNPESHLPQSASNESSEFDSHDLHWLAFCYVADELDHESRLAFESRLEVDQEARDAVSFAVLQSQTIHAAIAETKQIPAVRADRVSEQSSGYSVASQSLNHSKGGSDSNANQMPLWRRPAPLMTAAAALLMLAAIWAFEFGGNPSPSIDEDLAAVWVSDTWDGENLYESYSSVDFESDDEIVSVAFQKLDLNDEEDDWMLTALGEMDSDDSGYFEWQNQEGGLQ